MKKSFLPLLSFVVVTMLTISMETQAGNDERYMNIYATRLNVDALDGQTATISFSVNAPAKGVWVYVDKNGNGKFEDEDPVYGNAELTVKSNSTCTLKDVTVPGGEYAWAVKVKGNNSGTGVERFNTAGSYFPNDADKRPAVARDYNNSTRRYNFRYPKGLAVNAYTESLYCGYSYVGEAGELSGLATSDKVNRLGSSQGLYLFGPSLGTIWYNDKGEDITAAPFGAFKGGISWCEPDDGKNKYFGPNRVSTDKDGYVYVSENRPTSEIDARIWRVHHSQMTTANSPAFTCLLTVDQLKAEGIRGRVLATSVGYEGEQKMLYVITGTTSKAVLTDDNCHLSKWKITEGAEHACTLECKKILALSDIAYKTGAGNKMNQKLKSPQCSVVPGNENGDIWLFQRVDGYNNMTSDSVFAALHLDANWNADYRIESTAHWNRGGTGAISKHHTLNGESEYYLAMPSCPKNDDSDNKYVVKIFRMSRNASTGRIQRSLTYTLYRDYDTASGTPAGFGARTDLGYTIAASEGLDGVAFDVANNLYFTSSGQQRLYVYALPKENEHLTPASLKEKLNAPYKVTWENGVDNPVVSGEMKQYMYPNDALPTLSKEGYFFHGWYDNAACEGEPLTHVNCDATLYAKWTEFLLSDDMSDAAAIDNNRVLQLTNGTTTIMKVLRKIQSDIYSMLCLPFAVDATVLNATTWADGTAGSPLADASLRVFSGVSIDENGIMNLLFTAPDNDAVPANTPFLIKPTNDIASTICFHDITVEQPADLQNAGRVEHDDVALIGVINAKLLVASDTVYTLTESSSIEQSAGSYLAGLSGHFVTNEPAALNLQVGEDITTWLEQLQTHANTAYKFMQDGKIYIHRNGEVYSINGQRVQ